MNFIDLEIAKLPKDWQEFFQTLTNYDWWIHLKNYLTKEYQQKIIYPKIEQLFFVFQITAFKDIKVVIIGQDPYHTPNMANGLAFAVDKRKVLPPSLKNIIKKVNLEYNLINDQELDYIDLKNWAKQGVLLINAVMSVIANRANSHSQIGWLLFTEKLLNYLANKNPHLIYVGWGKFAQNQILKINNLNLNNCFFSVHPSPLSAYLGFFDKPLFSAINIKLQKSNLVPIKWY